MSGARRVIEEEGLVRSGLLLAVDIEDRLVGDLIAQVAAIGTDVSLIFHQVGLVLVGLRTKESEEVVEALSGRPMIEWAGVGRLFVRRYAILAHRKSVVAVVAQNLGDGTGRGRHAAVPAGKSGGHERVRKSGFVHGCAVTASQQRRAGRGADRARMEVRIAQTIVGQSVERGSLDQTRRMCRQRHSPHRRSVSTLRSGRRRALSQAPATILLTRQGFCQRLPDTAVPLAHAAGVLAPAASNQRRCQRLQYAFLVHKSPVVSSHSEMTRADLQSHPR